MEYKIGQEIIVRPYNELPVRGTILAVDFGNSEHSLYKVKISTTGERYWISNTRLRVLPEEESL